MVLLAVLVAAIVVPVGFALSLESTEVHGFPQAQILATDVSTVLGRGAILETQGPRTVPLLPFPESAKLLLVGTALFGLAAVLRKSV